MANDEPGPTGILALLPFLVNGALSLNVLRAMRERGMNVTVASYRPDLGGYPADPAEDFASAGRLLDMSRHHDRSGVDLLESEVCGRDIGLVLQIGSPWAYCQLPYLKERRPALRLMDLLYNRVSHTVNHFHHEVCFDGVIVESEDMRHFIVDRTLKADPGVRVVESGIDLSCFMPGPGPATERGALVVGYVGRMSPEKNPLGFVELAERLHAQLPLLRFRMFGAGVMESEVRDRISRGRAEEAIRYDGYADHPGTALASLDVLVVPSVFDGRPNIIMEANSCGVPVIAAPVGGIPELIEPGRNGALVDPRDHEQIARLLASWISDRAEYLLLRSAARAVAEERFDQSRMLDRYEAVFREFLPSNAV